MTDEPRPDTYPSGIPRPDFDPPQIAPEVMIVTGMSGAGRTQAAASLGDLGWYVVDNLPPQLLGGLVSMVGRGPRDRLAAVVDVRGREFFQDVESVMDDLQSRGIHVHLVFLDADDATLIQRFEEARRPHPLQDEDTLVEGIARERAVLAALRARADEVIDTSRLNVHQLRERIATFVGYDDQELRVHLLSFGFKNGVPADADYVADVRFLHNPHWVPELRPLTGVDPVVAEYVLASDGALEFLDRYAALLESVLPRFRAHDKHGVTIAIGCTGGKHRSVALVEALGARLTAAGVSVRVLHRDKDAA